MWLDVPKPARHFGPVKVPNTGGITPQLRPESTILLCVGEAFEICSAQLSLGQVAP